MPETKGNSTHGAEDGDVDEDFLTRERALLGDDADQFTSSADNNANAATVHDGEEDLLGGGDEMMSGGHEMQGFESSFPAVDTKNEVSQYAHNGKK